MLKSGSNSFRVLTAQHLISLGRRQDLRALVERLGFRKGRGTRNQIASVHLILEKAREFQKNIYFCFIDYTKLLTVWITTNCGKFLKRWEYQTT